MLLAGDEMGRTQQGNNNAYCQDNEISWLDWDHVDKDLLDFACRLIHFRRAHPVFRRRRWFQGQAIHGEGKDDIAWFDPCGEQASEQLWEGGVVHSLGIFINGENFPNPNARGEPVTDDSFYLIFNAHFEDRGFHSPAEPLGHALADNVRHVAEGWSEDGAALEAGATLSVVAAVVRAAAAAGVINLRTFGQFLRYPEAKTQP